MSPRHDLRHEVPWIPVIYLDGTHRTLPLQPLLEDSHLIREIAGEPATWAALMRFLPSVTALIVREDPHTDLEPWAEGGIPTALITAALDKVAGHLWLHHPNTPFMQDPDLIVPDTGPANSTEWLHLTPGASSKAWWGKPGDSQHPDAGTPARVAQGLVVSWFFSPGVAGRAVGTYTDAPDIGWRPRGTLSFGNHGLRVFWRGRTLAETLLANTVDTHVRAGGRGNRANLPLWAAGPKAKPSDGPLTAATWTGSTYQVIWDDTGSVPTGVHVGGRRIGGLPADPKARTAAVKDIEKDLWRSDPTIPRVPVVKAGTETGEVRPIRSLHPTASAMQWAAEWYASDERRHTARAMEPGLVDVAMTDVFAIRLEGQRTSPEVAYLNRVGEVSAIAAPGARARLASLSSLVVIPIRATLYGGLIRALGRESAAPLQERLFAAFCTAVEPILDDIVHAPEFTRAHAEQFASAAQSTFERFVTPYITPQTLRSSPTIPGIAAAIAFVEQRTRKTIRQVGE